ncbi:MAG TPA: trypsin-like peptidase domain-containing protein [Blastocatellia bacterium]|nr:trypsin-like peptidase domain-containing protein [Blastocatellia bacterium]
MKSRAMKSKAMKIITTWIPLAALLAISPVGADAQQLRDLFRKVKDSVVTIKTEGKAVATSPQEGTVSMPGLASGVLVSADGKILTAAHVVQAADKVVVEFGDGRIVQAHVVSSAVYADVALVQLDSIPQSAAPAKLGDSDKTEVGDEVFVVGAPYGLSRTLTAGHISGRKAPTSSLGSMSAWEFLQTDAAVNVGNSGGPMFNMSGEVVGIVCNIVTRSGGFEGISFAATSKIARILLLERKPLWTGIEDILVEGDLAKILNLPQPAGLLVQRVGDGSFGSRAGLRPGTLRVSIEGNDLLLGGDIILAVNGIQILEENASLDQIYDSIGKLGPDEKLVVKVLRAGQITALSSTIQ